MSSIPSAESETVEFKTGLAELKQGLISLAAMLNKHGQGELWFGIAPSGQAKGLHITEKTLRDVSQALAAHIEPRLYPEITAVETQGASCLRIQASGQQNPYFAYGRAYIRVADEDRQMSARELESFILQRNRDALRWDNEPDTISLADLDADKIRRFVARAGLPWGDADNSANALTKLGLLQDGQLLKTARLFFGQQPIQLHCAVFASHTSATILDRHDFDGDILALIDEAEKYILKNIHIGMRLEGLVRVDVPEIAPKALREALVNAFCHRDWRDPDYVQVAIFKDRLEIRSPGTLYGNLTLDDIRRGNVSQRRNPQLAELLRRAHLAEAWGRGVPLILENAPDAQFIEIGNLFITRFKRLNASDAPQADTDNNDGSGANTEKTPRKHQENTKQRLLTLVQQQPSASVREMAELLKLSQDSVRHHLRRLQANNTLRRVGPDKGGYWQLTDQNAKDKP